MFCGKDKYVDNFRSCFCSAYDFVRDTKIKLKSSLEEKGIKLELVRKRGESFKHPTGGFDVYSEFYGVVFIVEELGWETQVEVEGEIEKIGIFDDIVDAAFCYNKVVKELNVLGSRRLQRPLNNLDKFENSINFGKVNFVVERFWNNFEIN